MPQETFKTVIGKALLDAEFRNALLADSDLALAPFDLTHAEKAKLRKIDDETMDTSAHLIEKFINKRLANLGFLSDEGNLKKIISR
jgi:hypothetical protein